MHLAAHQLIVVVEGDEGLNQAIDRLLYAAGLSVMTFSSSEACLASPAVHRAACLVVDVHLPGLSGVELRRQLNECGIAPAVIYITGNDDRSTREEVQRSGPCAFLVKPFRGPALLSAINDALERG